MSLCAFLKWNSIGVKTINVLTTAITNRKLFFNGLKLRDRQWPLTGKVPEVEYKENLRENFDIRKVENGSYSKEILKRLVMSGVTYLCTIRLSKIGLKYMPKVTQI